MSALERLISILEARKIHAFELPWTNRKAVCFTECPWGSLLRHAQAYSPYGIGFTKKLVYSRKGNPVIYANPDMFQSEKWDKNVYPFVTPFLPTYAPDSIKNRHPFNGKAVDYTHEREWRVAKDFPFQYSYSTYDQVYDYALDLRNFQKESHNKLLVPIMVSTKAPRYQNVLNLRDRIVEPVRCNAQNLGISIEHIAEQYQEPAFDYVTWENSEYLPTPTIVEAAQALYRGHNVHDITRSDAGAENLTVTTDEINRIIEHSKANGRKSICFVTGVPGAGKTLVGLNIAIQRSDAQKGEAHDYAFQYFGGRTQMIAYDQDRVFVVDENFGNIVLVPKFEEYVRKMGLAYTSAGPMIRSLKEKLKPLCGT